jgi:hypothetical protein
MGLFSRIGDTFYALRFLRLLTTPWKKTGAYKAGLVDEDGKVIRSPETSNEKSVYTIFHKLVFNIKRLMNKLPFGKKTITSYLASLYLIKEHTSLPDSIIASIIQEKFDCDVNEILMTESMQHNIDLPVGEYILLDDVLLRSGNVLHVKGKRIIFKESLHETLAGEIFGIPVFRGTLVEGGQTVLTVGGNLKSPNQ